VDVTFEGWAYRKGFLQQIQRLERRKYLEQHKRGVDDRLIRLTEAGHLFALGGRDPVAQWDYPWDGAWRMVLYDLPGQQERRRSLLENGFGLLQCGRRNENGVILAV